MRAFLAILAIPALSACGPRDIADCKSEAAKMPTARGVSLAANECDKKFSWEENITFVPSDPVADAAALEAAGRQIALAYPYLQTSEGARALQLIALERDAQISRGVPPVQATLNAAQQIAPRHEPFANRK